jgi:transcriptional regulator with XRE-family HTH domain
MTQAEAARQLGVTSGHLNMVLHGHRQSRSLIARWEALQVEEAKRMSEEANPRFSQSLFKKSVI